MPHKPNPACLLFLWIKFYWNTVMLTHLQNDFFFSEAVQLCMAVHGVCDSEMLSCPVEWDLGHQRFMNSEQNICIFSPKIYNDRDFCKYIHIYCCMFFGLFPSDFPLPLTLEQFRVGALTLHAVENPHGNYSCPSLHIFPPYPHGSDFCCSRSYTVFSECYIEK